MYPSKGSVQKSYFRQVVCSVSSEFNSIHTLVGYFSIWKNFSSVRILQVVDFLCRNFLLVLLLVGWGGVFNLLCRRTDQHPSHILFILSQTLKLTKSSVCNDSLPIEMAILGPGTNIVKIEHLSITHIQHHSNLWHDVAYALHLMVISHITLWHVQ